MEAGAALATVRARMEAACGRAGRAVDAVRLVAVSKNFPAGAVRALFEAGQERFGENRVQEAVAKMAQVDPGARWHLVGPLQRNKARHAVGRFELIHSIDGRDLAVELDRRAKNAGVVQPILIQVRLGGEATKSGVEPHDLAALASEILALRHLDLRGLMTLPPPPQTPEDSRPWFRRLRGLRHDLASSTGTELPELSMGMTDDFEVAIEEGATLVRVGRALFGDRG